MVLVFAQHLLEKAIAGRAFLAEHGALAHAGVDEQAEGQGKIGLSREVADGLGPAVLFEHKVALLEIANDPALLVVHRGKHVDDFHFTGEGGRLGGAWPAGGSAERPRLLQELPP